MDPAELERLVDRELRRLPGPRAPRTLLPRVMAAVQAEAPAATGWFTWPLAWRASSLVLALVCAAGAAWLVIAPPPGLSATAQTAGQAVAVTRVLWDLLLQPAISYLFLLGVLLALACAAAWAALEVALGGASQR